MPTLTPPVLTAPSEIRLSRAGSLTFTDSAAWRAAITAVRLGGSYLTVTTDYTLAAGNLTILGNVIEKIGSYNLVIEATGYDDATAILEYVVCDWSSLTLYTTDEVTAIEPIVSSSLVSSSQLIVKQELLDDISSRFTSLQNELDDEESGIVIQDNIRDIRLLKQSARSRCLAIVLSAGQVSVSDDVPGIKAMEYMRRSLNEFARWAGIAPFDLGDYGRAHGTVRLVQ